MTGFIAATMLGSMTLSGVALADDISNDLDNTIDSVAEVLALNVGGANGTTDLYVTPRNGDGEQGCNLSKGDLTVAVASSNTAVATVSPSTVTFNGCGDVRTLTVTPVAAGSATISLTQTTNSTPGSFNLAPATFTVNVAPPANTAPTVSVVGVTGGASYAKGSVPSATCQVTDAEDGSSSFAATLSAVTGPYASDGIGEQTASCSYTDRGLLRASSSVTYSIVDLSGPSIDYALDRATPDGTAGWYRSDVSLTWEVEDPDSPSSVDRTDCVDQVITEDQAETTYTCSATSAGGSAGPVSVKVKRDATAPLVSNDVTVVGTVGLDGWYTSDVDVTFTASDGLSGLADTEDTVSSEGQGTAVAVRSPVFTDAAGNSSALGAVTKYFKIDKQAPDAPTASLLPVANGNGWNNADVTVHFADNGDNGPSGNVTCTPDVTETAETAGKVVSGTCTDAAGNTSAATEVTVRLDRTGPVITSSVAGTTGSNGWYRSDVTVTFTATDPLSGLATGTTSPKEVTSTGEGTAVTVSSPVFADRAGNSSGPVTKTFKVDKFGPMLSLDGGPSDGASYYFGSVPDAPTCQASDAISGPDGGCAVSGYSAAVGSQTLVATATDMAGNTTTQTRTYTVKAWTPTGFYAPVDQSGVLNTVKSGSTVPLKFEVFVGATELTSTSVVKSFTATKLNCSTSATEDAIEFTTTGGTSLRYDSTGGQFVQNWQTPKGAANSCYRVTVTTQDGSTITADFKLK